MWTRTNEKTIAPTIRYLSSMDRFSDSYTMDDHSSFFEREEESIFTSPEYLGRPDPRMARRMLRHMHQTYAQYLPFWARRRPCAGGPGTIEPGANRRSCNHDDNNDHDG